MLVDSRAREQVAEQARALTAGILTTHREQPGENLIDVAQVERCFRRRLALARCGDCCPPNTDAPLARPARQESDCDGHVVRRNARE